MKLGRATIGLGLALVSGACATVPRLRAADDVHALLVAIRDGDRARFEAQVDRPALRAQLQARLLAETAKAHGERSWQAAGVVLAGPLVGAGIDALIRPEVLRAEAIRLGYDPEQPLPRPLAIAALVRPLGDGRACVSERIGGPCVLAFNLRGGAWKLTGYEGPLGGSPAAPRRAAAASPIAR